MSTTTQPSHVSDEAILSAVETAWQECEPAAVNGWLCRDQVAAYCSLTASTLVENRLPALADDGAVASAMSVDMRTGTEVRTVAPLEVVDDE